MKLRYALGILFLALQIGSIIYARFIPERFFCWAPYDSHTKYEISVTIDNKVLSKDNIKKRYHYRVSGWEKRSIHNVFSYIKSYETSYGKNDDAKVIVTYSVNGNPQQIWTHP